MASFVEGQEMNFQLLEGRSKVTYWVDFQIQKKESMNRFTATETTSVMDQRKKYQKNYSYLSQMLSLSAWNLLIPAKKDITKEVMKLIPAKEREQEFKR